MSPYSRRRPPGVATGGPEAFAKNGGISALTVPLETVCANARAETVATMATYREAFKRRQCHPVVGQLEIAAAGAGVAGAGSACASERAILGGKIGEAHAPGGQVKFHGACV